MILLTNDKVRIFGLTQVAPKFHFFKLVTNEQVDKVVKARDMADKLANRFVRSMELAIRENKGFNQEWEKHEHTVGVYRADYSDGSNRKVVAFSMSTPDSHGRFCPVTHMRVLIDRANNEIIMERTGKPRTTFSIIGQMDEAEAIAAAYLKGIKPYKRL